MINENSQNNSSKEIPYIQPKNSFSTEKDTKNEKKSFFSQIKKFFSKRDSKSSNYHEEENPLSTTITPVKNSKCLWVPDEKALNCSNCQKIFSALFLRKHHCRICGNVFCKECSKKTIEGKYWGSI